MPEHHCPREHTIARIQNDIAWTRNDTVTFVLECHYVEYAKKIFNVLEYKQNDLDTWIAEANKDHRIKYLESLLTQIEKLVV